MNSDVSLLSGGEAGSAPHRSFPRSHPLEAERQESLRRYAPLARRLDAPLRRLCREAAECCEMPVAIVSVVEEGDERVLACYGCDVERVPRSASFCAHAILEPDALVMEDATRDPRFQANPAVVGDPFVRAYVGVPIFDATGLPLGAICVRDVHPREPSSRCLLTLRTLADVASALLETRLMLSEAGTHHVSRIESAEDQSRLDRLLLTLVESRSAYA